MDKTLTEVCDYLNNYFDIKRLEGEYTIEDGRLQVDGILEGQYYRITGSVFNDGVHHYTTEETDLKDETFTGSIWLMAVPETVLSLSRDIAEWAELYQAPTSEAMSPYNSESFGNYSYSKSSAGTGAGGDASSWTAVFATRLSKWRKLRGAR
jgi:hypothetical protein